MEYRALGPSGLKVSALCLGAMTFGEADAHSFMHNVSSDEATSLAIMDRAFEAGVNFIETSDVYGQDGLSEHIIGKWLSQGGKRGGKRDEVLVSTKFRFRTRPGPNGTGAARYHIMRAVEDSLRRLGTDRIDLYQLHMQDTAVPEEETLRALDDLVRQGKVLYIGCSNYAAYRVVHSLWTSKTERLERFVSLQVQYSLVHRDLEREHVPLCRALGVGLLPWAPLGGGFLSGKYRRGQAPPVGSRLHKWRDRYAALDTARNWRIVDAVTAMAKEHDASPAQVALAWVLGKSEVSSVLFGARSLAQLEDNLQAVELKLSAEQMAVLDRISDPELDHLYQFLKKVQGQW